MSTINDILSLPEPICAIIANLTGDTWRQRMQRRLTRELGWFFVSVVNRDYMFYCFDGYTPIIKSAARTPHKKSAPRPCRVVSCLYNFMVRDELYDGYMNNFLKEHEAQLKEHRKARDRHNFLLETFCAQEVSEDLDFSFAT